MVRSTDSCGAREDSCNLMSTSYDILCKDKILYKDLGQIEYFEVMEDLAIEYYQTGTPDPSELETKMYEVKE